MKRFNINLPDELYEKLRREAFDNNISMSQLILGMIDIPPKAINPKISTPEKKSYDEVKVNSSFKVDKKHIVCKHGNMPKLCKYQECRK